MSCDYQRREYWRQFSEEVMRQVSEAIRDQLEEAFKGAIDDLLKGFDDRTKATISKMRETHRWGAAFETTYRRAKESAKSREREWTLKQRREMASKTRKLLRRIRVMGNLEGLDPVHSETGLPRVSSQVGYAAVYDRLVSCGIPFDSPFDAVYERVEATIEAGRAREIIHHIERIEAELRKGRDADRAVIASHMKAIEAAAPEIHRLLSAPVAAAATS